MDATSRDIRHVVVLMLENRSFDCMLGRLHPAGPQFDGLTGAERNVWHKPDGTQVEVPVWNDPAATPAALCIPDPDPGERFADIAAQIAAGMGGFVDNYVGQQPPSATRDAAAVMHYFVPEQVPVISTLARTFGVADRWHASAPCQTWPNRFFVHCGTAGGWVNNSPTHFPYTMETVFNRLSDAGRDWAIYFHDFPQAATLARLWETPGNFRLFADFTAAAAAGSLPFYSFVEPRYFADLLGNNPPNDEHPPHDIGYGEALIAEVYNALRAGPGWMQTLLIVTYDEHGGCYDHVVPPPAVPPGGATPDGFAFDRFGVRVPAVIVSPYVAPGSIIRPAGDMPFDHTSIIATLRALQDFPPLTPRDAAAPDLLAAFTPTPDNAGPPRIDAPLPAADPAMLARLAAAKPNDLQHSLGTAAAQLPTAGANIAAHITRLGAVLDTVPLLATVDEAARAVAAHIAAFLA